MFNIDLVICWLFISLRFNALALRGSGVVYLLNVYSVCLLRSFGTPLSEV